MYLVLFNLFVVDFKYFEGLLLVQRVIVIGVMVYFLQKVVVFGDYVYNVRGRKYIFLQIFRFLLYNRENNGYWKFIFSVLKVGKFKYGLICYIMNYLYVLIQLYCSLSRIGKYWFFVLL